jgi:hypothetical protein
VLASTLQGLPLKAVQGVAAKIFIAPLQADGTLAQHLFAHVIRAQDAQPMQATPISGPNQIVIREDSRPCSYESTHSVQPISEDGLQEGAVGTFLRLEQAGVSYLHDRVAASCARYIKLLTFSLCCASILGAYA